MLPPHQPRVFARLARRQLSSCWWYQQFLLYECLTSGGTVGVFNHLWTDWTQSLLGLKTTISLVRSCPVVWDFSSTVWLRDRRKGHDGSHAHSNFSVLYYLREIGLSTFHSTTLRSTFLNEGWSERNGIKLQQGTLSNLKSYEGSRWIHFSWLHCFSFYSPQLPHWTLEFPFSQGLWCMPRSRPGNTQLSRKYQ